MAKLKSKKKVVVNNWHPDFRNLETLPDIKAIRTDFIFNIIAVSLFLGLFIAVSSQFYISSKLKSEVKDFEKNIESKLANDNKNLRLNAKFSKNYAYLLDVIDFTSVTVNPDKLFLVFSETIPNEMIIEKVSIADITIKDGKKSITTVAIQIGGSINGLPEEATQIVYDYMKTLSEVDILKDKVSENGIKLRSLKRNPKLQNFSFNISIETIPPKSNKDK